MRIGIFAKTFDRPSLEQILDAVKAQGLECVQFNMACAGLPSLPDRIEPKLADRIRTEMTRRGITMAAVSGTFNMIHPDLRERRQRTPASARSGFRMSAAWNFGSHAVYGLA